MTESEKWEAYREEYERQAAGGRARAAQDEAGRGRKFPSKRLTRGGWVDEEEFEHEEEFEVEDRYVERASDAVLKVIDGRPRDVFYERQLPVVLEKDYYHWITSRALDELAEDRLIRSEFVGMGSSYSTKMRFFFSNKLRYWKRSATKVRKLVLEYSKVDFTNAFGHHAEMLFDAALPREGFLPVAENVKEYDGKRWDETEHNLDRIFVRDGVAYGTEIKNQLGYLEFAEFFVKLRMCQHLGLRPLFIARMMPKSYIWDVIKAGGFCLIFKYQLYPFGHRDLAERVANRLSLPVKCPAAIEAGTVRRFLKWHLLENRIGKV